MDINYEVPLNISPPSDLHLSKRSQTFRLISNTCQDFLKMAAVKYGSFFLNCTGSMYWALKHLNRLLNFGFDENLLVG